MSESKVMRVYFSAGTQKLKPKGRYRVILMADGYSTGIETVTWGHKRALKVRDFLVANSVDLLNQAGLMSGLLDHLTKVRKEEAMASLKPGQRVRLAVDIGPFKEGRVCKVMAVNPDGETKYGISVQPVYMSGDGVTFGEGDWIALAPGEYAPLNEETE